MTTRPPYVVAFYEIDRAFGGPEEGGWWYDTGELCRPLKVVFTESAAEAAAACANRLMTHLQRHKRDVGSVAYAGGRYAACVFEDTAPRVFPRSGRTTNRRQRPASMPGQAAPDAP